MKGLNLFILLIVLYILFHSDHSAEGKKGGIFWDAGQGFLSTIMTWNYVHLMWGKKYMWHIGKFRFFSGFQVNWCHLGIRSMWPVWPTLCFIRFVHEHNMTYGTSMCRVHPWTSRELNATLSGSRWPIWSIGGEITSWCPN